MDDLVDRLRELEQNPAPDLWPDVRDRVAGAVPKVARSPLRRRVLTGGIAAVIGVAAVALVVIAFRPSTEHAPTASPILAPAPRDCPTRPFETPPTGVAEFTGLIHGYLPTWLPEGFGLLRTYGGEAVRRGRNAYGVWSDGRCREVELSFGPNSLAFSGFLPGHGPWTVSDLPGECGNKVLGKSACLYYFAKTPNGVLTLAMSGLDRADGDRIALSILPGHVECTAAPTSTCPPPSSTPVDPTATIVTSTIVIDDVDGADLYPPLAGAGPVLTADQAIARFEAADPAFRLPSHAEVFLGEYSGSLITNDQLAYGIRFHRCSAISVNPFSTLSPSPSVSCTYWLFINADTGTMLEARAQAG